MSAVNKAFGRETVSDRRLRTQNERAEQYRARHGYRLRHEHGGLIGLTVVIVTVLLAMSGSLTVLAIAYGFALLVLICAIAVAVPVIVVWSLLEEARGEAKRAGKGPVEGWPS